MSASACSFLLGGFAWGIGESGTRDVFDYGVGARALGMGNAYVGVSKGVSGLTWNPAALDVAERSTLESMVTVLPFGGLYSHAAFALPILNAGTVAIGASTVTADSISSFTEDFIPGVSFGYLRIRALAGYGQTLGSLPIQVGATLRMDYFNTASIQTTYVNADVGARFSFLEFGQGRRGYTGTELVLGIALKNLLAFSGPKLSGESDIEPLSATFGLMFSHQFHRFLAFRLSGDFLLDSSSNMSVNMGFELQVLQNIDLRGGYVLGQGLSAGAGLRLGDMEVSYAALFRNANINHNFSLNWSFGESRKARGYRLAAEEKDAIDLAVTRNIDDEKDRLNRLYAEIQSNAMEEMRRNREIAEREQRALLQAKETALALSMESNRLATEQIILSNQLMVESLRSSNEQWVETMRRSNEIIVQELSQSNQYLSEAINRSNVEWKQALDTSNRRWSETLMVTKQSVLASNQEAMAMAAKSNELAIQALMQANAQAREVLNNRAKENVNRLNRQIAENQTKQKNIEAMYNTALAAFNTGNADDALVQFKKILELDPGNQEVAGFIKKIEDAKRPVENYTAEEVELYREGMKHFLKKDYAKAIEVWDNLLKRYPYNNLAIQGVEKAKKRLKGN